MIRTLITRPKILAFSKYLIASLIAINFCVSHSAAANTTKKNPKYGTIKILTTPGGLPLTIDGRSFGETTTEYRSLDLDPGPHTIVIKLPDGRDWTREIVISAGRIKCVALNYRPAPTPPPLSPCPFPVNVSAPSTVNDGEVITFTADVGYSGVSPVQYSWTLSPTNVRILSGAGTSTITVDSTGLAGQRITASLIADDGSDDPMCRQAAQASTYIPPLAPREIPAREFDVCCSCTSDDQKARLDNLAIELQHDPTAMAYIIAYSGRGSRVGQADFLSTRSRDYLVNKRGLSPSRIVNLNGGFREEDCVELWLVPAGAAPPLPRPTVRTR